MFDYFDSLSVFMKLIRLGRISIHKSELEKVTVLMRTDISEKELAFEPLRLYLYVPP